MAAVTQRNLAREPVGFEITPEAEQYRGNGGFPTSFDRPSFAGALRGRGGLRDPS